MPKIKKFLWMITNCNEFSTIINGYGPQFYQIKTPIDLSFLLSIYINNGKLDIATRW